MGRKLVKQGRDALTVSLPRKWLDRYNLNAGDELEVLEEENKITLYTKQSLAKKKTTLDASKLSEKIIYNMLNFMYIRGDDEITINFLSQKELNAVKHMIPSLIGFVVIKETKDTCVIKDMSGSVAEDMDEMVKRIFVLLNSFMSDAIVDIKKGVTSDIEIILSRDRDINRMSSLALRTLNKKSIVSKEHSQALFNIITTLEHLGDEVGRMWRVASEFKVQNLENIDASMNFAQQSLEKVYEIYYRFNKKALDDLVKLRQNAREEFNTEKNSIPEIRFSKHTLQICEECVEMMQSIFMIRL